MAIAYTYVAARKQARRLQALADWRNNRRTNGEQRCSSLSLCLYVVCRSDCILERTSKPLRQFLFVLPSTIGPKLRPKNFMGTFIKKSALFVRGVYKSCPTMSCTWRELIFAQKDVRPSENEWTTMIVLSCLALLSRFACCFPLSSFVHSLLFQVDRRRRLFVFELRVDKWHSVIECISFLLFASWTNNS